MHMKNRFSNISCLSVMLILALLFAISALWDFGLPGLYLDEVNHYAYIPGIIHEGALHLHHYRLPDNWLDYQDKVNRYPIVGGSFYNSTIRTYVALPFLGMTGYSTESLRIFVAITAYLGTATAVGLLGRVFGWAAALVAGLIIVTDPTNAFLMRAQGGLFWFVVGFIALAGHFLFTAAKNEKSSIWQAVGAGVAISLATSSYYIGFFFSIPLIIISAYIYRNRISHFFALLIAGLIAYSPIIYAVVSVHLKSPKLLDNMGMPAFALKDRIPTYSLENLEHIAATLHESLNTFGFAINVVGQFDTGLTFVRAISILACLVAIAIIAIKKSNSSRGARVFYVFSVAAISIHLIAMIFLHSITYHHLVPMAILVALLAASLATNENPTFQVLGKFACAILLLTNTIGLFSAHAELRRTGGAALHNETVSQPALLFKTTLRDFHPVFASWGFHLQYLFLTEGRQPYTFMTKVNKIKIDRAIEKYGSIAIVVATEQREQVLKEFQPKNEYFFTQRDGKAIYSIMLLPSSNKKIGPSGSSAISTPERIRFSGSGTDRNFMVSVYANALCEGQAIGKVSWEIKHQEPVNVKLFIKDPGEKTRKLWMDSSLSKGEGQTGPWVKSGMEFFLVKGNDGTVLDSLLITKPSCH